VNKEADAFTAEVIRHKLATAIEEGSVTLEAVSGTPITAEAHDYMVSLFTAKGDLLDAGAGYVAHVPCASHVVKHLIANFSDDPGIFEGDVYFVNDPFLGVAHTSDAYIIVPCYVESQLGGFTVCFVHLTDIGAMDPGGFCPEAKECYQEGFSTKGLKIVERGKLRRDVFETFLNMVRDPSMVALDLKSLMAASLVVKDRLIKIYHDYGYETVNAVSEQLMRNSERLFKERLRELPDGIFRARQYLDYHGKLGEDAYPLELALIKEGDTLTFDFTGTHAQLPIGFNCGYWATFGRVFAGVFPILCPDLPWNEGITKVVKVIAPEGTMVHAKRPAPTNTNTVGILSLIGTTATLVISKMLGASEKYKNWVTAVWKGTDIAATISGLDHRGQYVQGWGSDGFAAAGGARAFKDGVDNGGDSACDTSRVPNVETNEAYFPIFYLYKRVVPDSGGPGKYRGGVVDEWAFTHHDSPKKGFSVVCFPGRGVSFPVGSGLFGGYPGCNSDYIQFRKSNASELPFNFASTKGAHEDHVCFGNTEIAEDDIMYMRGVGGGGYGDPLDRDPELVLNDVLRGLVTDGPAQDIYGVIIDYENKRVDVEATYKQRWALRKDRLGGRPPRVDTAKRADIPLTGMRLNEYLQMWDSGGKAFLQCTWCGEAICPPTANWKDHVVRRKISVAEGGPLRRESGLYLMWQFFCPGCGTLLDSNVVFKDDPPPYDEIFRWPK
jgi:N-methylhydantoinase B